MRFLLCKTFLQKRARPVWKSYEAMRMRTVRTQSHRFSSVSENTSPEGKTSPVKSKLRTFSISDYFECDGIGTYSCVSPLALPVGDYVQCVDKSRYAWVTRTGAVTPLLFAWHYRSRTVVVQQISGLDSIDGLSKRQPRTFEKHLDSITTIPNQQTCTKRGDVTAPFPEAWAYAILNYLPDYMHLSKIFQPMNHHMICFSDYRGETIATLETKEEKPPPPP